MKSLFFLMGVCIVLISPAQSRWQWGGNIGGGVNINTGNSLYLAKSRYSWAIQGNVFTRYHISKYWELESGLSASYKNIQYDSYYIFGMRASSSPYRHSIRYQYFTLPLLVGYKLYMPRGQVLHIQLGHELGQFLGCSRNQIYQQGKEIYKGRGFPAPELFVSNGLAKIECDFPFANHFLLLGLRTSYYYPDNGYDYFPLDANVRDFTLGLHLGWVY
jgi:hypothetical protein